MYHLPSLHPSIPTPISSDFHKIPADPKASKKICERFLPPIKIIHFSDFPSGPVDKNLPAKAEDTGLITGLGRFHMLGAT